MINRIKTIMEAEGLNAMAFAERLGIQRSGLSHIFNGRNKPSLDLILKILDEFQHVSAAWLLKGIGEYNNNDYTGVNKPQEDKISNKSEIDTDVTLTKDTNVNIMFTDDVTDITSGKSTGVNNVFPPTSDEIVTETNGNSEVSQIDNEKEFDISAQGKASIRLQRANVELTVLYADGTYKIYTPRS